MFCLLSRVACLYAIIYWLRSSVSQRVARDQVCVTVCHVFQPDFGLKEIFMCLQMYHKLRGRDGRFEPLSDFAVAQAADVSCMLH